MLEAGGCPPPPCHTTHPSTPLPARTTVYVSEFARGSLSFVFLALLRLVIFLSLFLSLVSPPSPRITRKVRIPSSRRLQCQQQCERLIALFSFFLRLISRPFDFFVLVRLICFFSCGEP